MARIYLSAEQRRSQIMDEAHRLFVTQGYEATTVEDIMTAVGIAKGTLYHHFENKQAILEALVARTVERSVAAANQAATGPGTPIERFFAVLAAARASAGDVALAEQFHGRDEAFHLFTLTEMFTGLVPVLTQVVEEGIETGHFSTSHPREAVEVVLAAGTTLLDGGIFLADADRQQLRTIALLQAFEQVLGAPPGSAVAALNNPDLD